MAQETDEKIVKEFIMPSACKDNIDLIHVDKGKVVTMGKYPTGKKGKLTDQACLVVKENDHPYMSTEVKVTENMNEVDFFAVTHHGLPIRIHPWVGMAGILYALPAQKGMRFDVGFKGRASCDFVKSDPPYIIQTPMRKKELKEGNVEPSEDSDALHVVIDCKGKPSSIATAPTADKLDRAEKAKGRNRSKLLHGSVLREFVDAGKWRKDNNTRVKFNSGGKIEFVPNYFTKQWFMIRGGGQLKTKDVFGDRKIYSGLVTKLKRLEDEIEFLFDNGESKTIVDFQGKSVEIGLPSEASDKVIKGSDQVGKDPNSYVIHKAFIDPAVMESISMMNPRHGEVKNATISVKPSTICEIRTNFKRRPAPMIENLLFCTKLDDEVNTFDEKASAFIDTFEDSLEEMKKLQKK